MVKVVTLLWITNANASTSSIQNCPILICAKTPPSPESSCTDTITSFISILFFFTILVAAVINPLISSHS
ncbi:hypothetical protein L6452_20117 [Arctium lappa]|uniref:Uncharacterized protein n=1 Tax=Arctium lappa TaxID=4217 RepID=A0ACB9B9Z8_ARCLA|nr:hypothetical protein L6452_20117 [Arctium lappa]